MALYETPQTIINKAAVEVGLAPVVDVFASIDASFRQLRYLTDSVCQDLSRMALWKDLIKEHTWTTDSGADDGEYPLPTDFLYMVPQSHWNRTDDIPLFGPLSAQDWSYLEGRGLSSQTIYASFRLKGGSLFLYPKDPVPDAKELAYEYVMNTWVANAAEDTFYTGIQAVDDLIYFPELVVVKYLKCKFLEAKGFDSSKARDEFNDILGSTFSQDKSAPILSASQARRGVPYLSGWGNVPDTGYGT